MTENNQDQSQSGGQEGIDSEIEQRNRENESGQSGAQQFGQAGSGSGEQQDSFSGSPSGGGESSTGGATGGDTSLADRSDDAGGHQSSGLGSSGETGGAFGGTTGTGGTGDGGSSGASGGSFVGSGGDQSSDYLTRGQSGEGQDFASEGQGASGASSGGTDIETGQSQDRQSGIEDGSDSDSNL